MNRGDKALAGESEHIVTHRFPPNPTKSRTMYFAGEYLLIVNQQTNEQKVFKEHVEESTPFEVPAEYTAYVRGAVVYFQEESQEEFARCTS